MWTKNELFFLIIHGSLIDWLYVVSIYSRIIPSYRDSRSMTYDQRRLFIVPYLLWQETWVMKYLQKALSRKIPMRTKVNRVPQKISRRLYEMKLVISYIFWANGVLGYSSLWVVTRTTLCCRFRPLALPFLLAKKESNTLYQYHYTHVYSHALKNIIYSFADS